MWPDRSSLLFRFPTVSFVCCAGASRSATHTCILDHTKEQQIYVIISLSQSAAMVSSKHYKGIDACTHTPIHTHIHTHERIIQTHTKERYKHEYKKRTHNANTDTVADTNTQNACTHTYTHTHTHTHARTHYTNTDIDPDIIMGGKTQTCT